MVSGGQTNLNDERVTAEAGANQTVVRIEMPKESPWKHPAIYIAIGALLLAFWAEREARLGEYYAIDLELRQAQAGMHPPADPWGKAPKENPK